MVALSVAAYRMCEKYDGMDHLRLQKSLYIAQMFYAGLHNAEKLIDTSFYAWKYGPVSVELYHQLQEYGRSRIPYKSVWGPMKIDENDPDIEFLDFISGMIKKSGLTNTGLINYTHEKGGAWDKLRAKKGRYVLIPEKAMAEDYNERHPDVK